MPARRPELAAFGLTGLVVVAATVIAATGGAIPSWFAIVALAALTGGAGLAPPAYPVPEPAPALTATPQPPLVDATGAGSPPLP